MTFKQALRKMPTLLHASYDPLSHTTVADLLYLAEHEIDLCVLGEETDIRTNSEFARVQDFRDMLRRESA